MCKRVEKVFYSLDEVAMHAAFISFPSPLVTMVVTHLFLPPLQKLKLHSSSSFSSFTRSLISSQKPPRRTTTSSRHPPSFPPRAQQLLCCCSTASADIVQQILLRYLTPTHLPQTPYSARNTPHSTLTTTAPSFPLLLPSLPSPFLDRNRCSSSLVTITCCYPDATSLRRRRPRQHHLLSSFSFIFR